jgi:hypothetical protein
LFGVPKAPEEVGADRVVEVIAVEGQPSMRLSARIWLQSVWAGVGASLSPI